MCFKNRQQKLKHKLGLESTFDEHVDILLPLFHMAIHDFIEICAPKNTAELYELLLEYETRYGTDHGGVSGSRRKRALTVMS